MRVCLTISTFSTSINIYEMLIQQKSIWVSYAVESEMFCFRLFFLWYVQVGRGHWTVNYTGTYPNFTVLRSRLILVRLRVRPTIKKNSSYFFDKSIFDFWRFYKFSFDKNGLEKLKRGVCTRYNRIINNKKISVFS